MPISTKKHHSSPLQPQSPTRGSSTDSEASMAAVSAFKKVQTEQQQQQEHPLGRNRRRHRVCLFGISGDPPTGTAGHVGIVQQLQKTLLLSDAGGVDDDGDVVRVVDEIRVLPVYRHTFVEKQERLISFHHRMDMCQRAFGTLLGVTVSNAEYESWLHAVQQQQQKRQQQQQQHEQSDDDVVVVGTAALLDFLHATEPETDFFFCLGADSFISLMEGKWQQSERVLRLLEGRLIVVNRIMQPTTTSDDKKESGHDNSEATRQLEALVRSVPGGAMLLPPNPQLGSVSSSQLRTLLRQREQNRQKGGGVVNEKLNEQMISSAVLEYICEHGLYLQE